MKTHITSDIHFFHKNILKYNANSRQFTDVHDMNKMIVSNWNEDVAPDDITYILGDVTFGKLNQTIDFLHQMNGDKILILGNHDNGSIRTPAFRECFTEIHSYKELKINGTKVILMHYPIEHWNAKHYGSIHFHGHLHGNPISTTGRIRDVGMDTNNCRVYNLHELVDEMKQIPYKDASHHGHVD